MSESRRIAGGAVGSHPDPPVGAGDSSSLSVELVARLEAMGGDAYRSSRSWTGLNVVDWTTLLGFYVLFPVLLTALALGR